MVDPEAGDRRRRPSRRSTRRPRARPVAWRHRHLLDVDGLSGADIDLVMRTTDAMREVLARPIAKVPALRGRQVTILFYEASTRTRVSFEVAAKNLSADVVNIAAASSSVSKGESLVDTVRTVEALGAQMLVMRHSVSGAPYLAAEIFGGSVLNGGDGWHAHPTQALLDLYTMRERLPGGSLAGRKVVILGDLLHSRVARSNIWTLTAAGADLWLCGPATLRARVRGVGRPGRGGRPAVPRDDVGRRGAARRRRRHGPAHPARADGGRAAAVAARIRRALRADRASACALAQPGALVMHPGPMNEGVEIARRRRGRRPVGHHGPGHERRRGPDGAAVPARRGTRRGTRDRRRVSGEGPDLEISRAWLVDPASGREGPGEIVVTDGILEAVTWLTGADADGIDADGVVVAPGFIDLHAHLREPGNEDAETVASGLAAAAHGGFTTVCAMPNTTPALDEPGVLAGVRAAAVASGSPVELLALRRGHGRAGRGAAGGARRAGRRGRRRLLRRRVAGPVRARSCGRRSPTRARSGCRSSTMPRIRPDRGRRGERRVRRDGARAARLAGRGRGDGGRPRPRGPRRRRCATCRAPGCTSRTCRPARALELVRRAKAAGLPVTCDVTPHHLALTDEWIAGARRWAWEASGDPWSDDGDRRRRRTTRRCA